MDVGEVGIQGHQRSSFALADFSYVPVRMPTEPLIEDSQGIVPSLAQEGQALMGAEAVMTILQTRGLVRPSRRDPSAMQGPVCNQGGASSIGGAV